MMFYMSVKGSLTLNPLHTEILLNNIYEFGPHLTGNALRLHYKAQPVNAV
jgi:hypothetical protein